LSIGDDALRRSYTVILFLVIFLASPDAIGAGKIRMKWVTSIYSDANGIGLRYPEGVTCGEDFVVVADTGNSRLLRYRYEGPSVTTEAEFPLPKSQPIIVQVNSRGVLYYLDGRERRIGQLSPSGEEKSFLSLKSLPSPEEIVPKSFRIDDHDNFYILDIFSAQVLVLDADAQYSRGIPFPEDYGFFSDLAVDRQGVVFLLDSVEAVLWSTAADSKTFSPMTASMKEYMNFPTRLSIDQQGILYLVDQNGSGLGIIAQDGSFLGRKLGLGWKESGLYYPSQMCISANGTVFIADRNNSRIQMFEVDRN
jgi:sugar lactone lactonase YvrE